MRKLLALTLLTALTASWSSAAYADSPIGGLVPHKFGPHTLFGTIASLTTTTLVLRRRNGKLIVTNIATAVQSGELGVLYVGRPVALHGDFDGKHVYTVDSITSANGIRFGADPADQ